MPPWNINHGFAIGIFLAHWVLNFFRKKPLGSVFESLSSVKYISLFLDESLFRASTFQHLEARFRVRFLFYQITKTFTLFVLHLNTLRSALPKGTLFQNTFLRNQCTLVWSVVKVGFRFWRGLSSNKQTFNLKLVENPNCNILKKKKKTQFPIPNS